MTHPRPVKFLLVDDLEENLFALEALLKRDGLAFLKARSGEEALEILLVEDVALALLDVQMPGMSGLDLAQLMRGNERTRSIPIIFLTAGGEDRQRRFRGYEAGAVDFIQKPVEAGILRSKAQVFFELHQQRQQIVEQRDELAVLTHSLRETDRRKNDFLAVLAHELRNPIMALSSGLRLLDRSRGDDVFADIRGRMDLHVRHMARLIEDLIDVARIDQGKISLKIERVSLQDVLSFAIETAQPHIQAAGHALRLDISAETIWLNADHARVTQIVGNLLNNAAKYTPPNGEIGLSAHAMDGEALIEVSDTGLGIPADMQSKIFDMFTQARQSGSVANDGLGIGLALVRQLVELHGGTIRLKSSEPGRGSVFEVRFPLPNEPM